MTTVEIPTGSKSKLIVRSTPNIRGKPWVDWVVVKWPKHEIEGGSDNQFCIARVHGFVRYEVDDYPTFAKRHGIKRKDKADKQLYVVIDAATEFVDINKLGTDIVHHFEINESDKGLHIFPVGCIARGIAVVTDFKSKTSAHFLAVAPRKSWSNLFTSRIRCLRSELLNSESHSESDVETMASEDESTVSGSFDDISIEDTDDDEADIETEEASKDMSDIVKGMLDSCEGAQPKKLI